MRTKSHFMSGFVTTAVVALLLSVPYSATAGVPDDCSAQLDRVARALTGGPKITPAHMTALERCLVSQPGAFAGSLERRHARGTTAQDLDAAAAVVASFQNEFVCFNFNSDGTVSSHYGSGFLTVTVSGGYFGVPGIFTVFGYTGLLESRGAVEFSSFGLTIGAFSVEIFTIYSGTSILDGLQTANCPG